MDRREILKLGGWVAGGVALTGAYSAKQLYARSVLKAQLLDRTEPILTQKALSELRELPEKAREEIRTWFHAPCLNAIEFARVVSSEGFRQKVARCSSRDQEAVLFLSEFLTHVASESEILNRVTLIAQEIGDELDLNWEACCRELSQEWNLQIRSYGSTLPPDFAARLEPTIRAGLEESLQAAKVAGQRPALTETTQKIGQSAILMLPLAPISGLVIPLFMLVAVSHLYDYYAGLQNSSAEHLRKAITSRLSLLGNRIGSEFESEVRTAIGRLHEWQQRTVTAASIRYAEESTAVLPIFS